LAAGAFFKRDELPELPQPLSLARRMIDWWRNES
jgi:NAD+ diphosphatase